MVFRFGIVGFAADSSLRTIDLEMARHERACGSPSGASSSGGWLAMSRMVDQIFATSNPLISWLRQIKDVELRGRRQSRDGDEHPDRGAHFINA
jgi:hypothetical protein